jgi:hypothetical protein
MIPDTDTNAGGGNTPDGNTPPPNNEPRTFTQEQLDNIIKERLKKANAQLEAFKDLPQKLQGTEAEKNELSQRLEELTQSLLTKEELAKREKSELEKRSQQQIETLSKQVNEWQERYTNTRITREITDAAVASEAFRPSQIVALLKDNVKMVKDEATGELITQVTFTSRDEEGNPKQLLLSVPDAVKEMQRLTDDYGNLFKSGLTGGVGGTGSTGDRKELTPKDIPDFASYQKYREQLKGK